MILRVTIEELPLGRIEERYTIRVVDIVNRGRVTRSRSRGKPVAADLRKYEVRVGGDAKAVLTHERSAGAIELVWRSLKALKAHDDETASGNA